MSDDSAAATSALEPASTPRELVVKSGAGVADAERCAQAFTVSATAVASGTAVSLWLMGDAVHLARPGVAEAFVLEGSAPLSALRDAVVHGGAITVCTQCAARRSLSADDLLPGIRLAGAAAYVDEILRPSVQAIVY